MMMKTLQIAVVTGLLSCAAIVPAQAATSVIELDTSLIRLGQIFHGIGNQSDIIVGAAPAPGQSMTLDSRQLLKLAKTYGVKWQPGSEDDQVVLRRSGTDVTAEDQLAALRTALEDKGVPEGFAVKTVKPLSSLSLAKGVDHTIRIEALSYNPATKEFSAMLKAGGKTVPVKGFVNQMVSVPVLKEPLSKGQMISASDLSFITVSADTLSKSTVTSPDMLVGLVASRTLEPNKPMRMNDVNMQRLVQRGQEVDIIYADGGMRLTARGKAMQNGNADDLVKVVNLGSNKSFDGRVTGDGEVTVY